MDIEIKTKKPSSPKFNAFDVVIIAILLLAIIIPIVLTVRAERESNALGNKESIVYKIRIDNLTPESAAKIAKKQNVNEGNTGKSLGTVYSVSSALPYRNYTQTEEGIVETLEDDSGLCYIVVTIKASAVYNDVEGYTVDGERIVVGKSFELRFPDFEATGVCVNLSGSSRSGK